eukprot:1706797-Rhodomonas_salina.8
MGLSTTIGVLENNRTRLVGPRAVTEEERVDPVLHDRVVETHGRNGEVCDVLGVNVHLVDEREDAVHVTGILEAVPPVPPGQIPQLAAAMHPHVVLWAEEVVPGDAVPGLVHLCHHDRRPRC